MSCAPVRNLGAHTALPLQACRISPDRIYSPEPYNQPRLSGYLLKFCLFNKQIPNNFAQSALILGIFCSMLF